MKSVQTLGSLFLSAAFAIGAVACGDDGSSSPDVDAAADEDAGAQFICDPVGSIPGVGTLLNTSLDNDVEVIVKEAQHPGDPGPLDLP